MADINEKSAVEKDDIYEPITTDPSVQSIETDQQTKKESSIEQHEDESNNSAVENEAIVAQQSLDFPVNENSTNSTQQTSQVLNNDPTQQTSNNVETIQPLDTDQSPQTDVEYMKIDLAEPANDYKPIPVNDQPAENDSPQTADDQPADNGSPKTTDDPAQNNEKLIQIDTHLYTNSSQPSVTEPSPGRHRIHIVNNIYQHLPQNQVVFTFVPGQSTQVNQLSSVEQLIQLLSAKPQAQINQQTVPVTQLVSGQYAGLFPDQEYKKLPEGDITGGQPVVVESNQHVAEAGPAQAKTELFDFNYDQKTGKARLRPSEFVLDATHYNKKDDALTRLQSFISDKEGKKIAYSDLKTNSVKDGVTDFTHQNNNSFEDQEATLNSEEYKHVRYNDTHGHTLTFSDNDVFYENPKDRSRFNNSATNLSATSYNQTDLSHFNRLSGGLSHEGEDLSLNHFYSNRSGLVYNQTHLKFRNESEAALLVDHDEGSLAHDSAVSRHVEYNQTAYGQNDTVVNNTSFVSIPLKTSYDAGNNQTQLIFYNETHTLTGNSSNAHAVLSHPELQLSNRNQSLSTMIADAENHALHHGSEEVTKLLHPTLGSLQQHQQVITVKHKTPDNEKLKKTTITQLLHNGEKKAHVVETEEKSENPRSHTLTKVDLLKPCPKSLI